MKKTFPFLFFTLVFLLAFAPIASFVFALKNDFFLGYFPPKFLLSETLRSGQFPLWNPYISFGLPFYADMNGAYWNPITWFVALTSGYSAYTLTLELLLYVFLGGWGMFKLAAHYTGNKYIRIISGLAYMCNGFIIGHLQHLNWISCSAFLPWCIWGILNINKIGSLKNILISVILFYLLISSSHPGMIIGSIYFFAALMFFLLYRKYKEAQLKGLKIEIKKYLLFFILLLLLSSGQIAGYLDILPYFDRNTKVDIELSLTENTTLQSWISLLLPLSTTKNQDFFNNDIAFRNNYIGLVLLCFFIASVFYGKIKTNAFYLLTGLFFLLLSSGGAIKHFALNYLPLIGYVRLNAEFRIFAIICFIISATRSFDHYLVQKDQSQNILSTIIKSLIIISFLIFTFTLFRLFTNGTLLYKPIFQAGKNVREVIKVFIDSLQYNETLLIQSFIQTILLILLLYAFKQKNLRKIVFLTAIDLVLSTNLNLPFTGVGKASVSDIHSIHQQSPTGIPTPKLQPLILHDTIPNSDSSLVGDWSFYNKQIGKSKPVLYPVKLSNNQLYYQLINIDSSASMAKNPFIFISPSIDGERIVNSQNISQQAIQSFTTNYINLKFNSYDSGYLILLQNYYPHWYYKTKNKDEQILNAGINFMAAPIKKGENEIYLYFNPVLIKILFVISSLTLLIFIIVLIRLR